MTKNNWCDSPGTAEPVAAMEPHTCSQLVQALGAACRKWPIAEKRLIAPSRRVGVQWLDTLARNGQPVMNVRVDTLESLALELADPELLTKGLTFLHGYRAEVLAACVFGKLANGGGSTGGYLTILKPSPGLIQTILGSLKDLRLAGLQVTDLRAPAFEVARKGNEIAALLSAWEQGLEDDKLVDAAGVLRMAAVRLRKEAAALSADALVLMPSSAVNKLAALEKEFWRAIPSNKRAELETDRPAEAPAGMQPTDANLLRWLGAPQEAPAPRRDGTAKIFRAVGEVNEVREVFRRCVAERLPLDQVEVIHTDTDTYVPLVFELAARVAPGDEPVQLLPVTFAEGLPVRYFRPGRALAAWVSWIREDCPQGHLARMIQDALLKLPASGDEEAGGSLIRLASLLRSIPIGTGRDHYLPAIDAQIAAVEEQLKRPGSAGEEEEDSKSDSTRVRGRLNGLQYLRALVEAVLHVTPTRDAKPVVVLQSARAFLENIARGTGAMDNYGREKLVDEVAELTECLVDGQDVPGLDIWGWLAELPHTARIGGQGPRPGCIYVSNIYTGGYSGRKHTFIVGMDDARFPGSGRQDPLLLDHERGAISKDLPTAAARLRQKVEALSTLLAKLRGCVTLSYSCRDIAEDREKQPSAALLAAYRVISGERDGDLQAMLKFMGAAASFAPSSESRCLDGTEWWLWRVCGPEGICNPEEVIAQNFPHLGRGLVARNARLSSLFTEYDGYVPEAGKDLDPTKKDGPVLSGSRLEKLGKIPLAYFFQYVLEIEPPDEFEIAPDRWLEPMDKGRLLHSVFSEFMRTLRSRQQLPEYGRDLKLLSGVFEKHIAEYRHLYPAPNDEVFKNECRQMEKAAKVFLREEEMACKSVTPMYFEVALGLPQDGGTSALDSPGPLAVRLPGGKVIRLHGRIDRVDQIAGHKFGIIDYKTGGSYGFDPKDPFRQGRHVQNVLYLVMMQQRLQETFAKDAVVARFGYFFPSHKELGKRVEWEAADLQGGLPVVELLVDMLARGCFPLSNDFAKDLEFPNDYSSAFGDARAGAQAITAKMANPQNKALVPFISLRNLGKGEELPAASVSPKAPEGTQDNQSGSKSRRAAR